MYIIGMEGVGIMDEVVYFFTEYTSPDELPLTIYQCMDGLDGQQVVKTCRPNFLTECLSVPNNNGIEVTNQPLISTC